MVQRVALKFMLVGVLVLAAIAVLVASPAQYPRVPTVCPGPSYFGGVPAIRPRNDCTPSFTEQDVRSYLAVNLQLALVNLQSGLPNGLAFIGHPQIVSIRFLSMRDLSREPYAPDWLAPSDMIVCYVVLHGTFFPIHGSEGAVRLLQRFPSPAYIVFDAHSGNVLGSGFGGG